MTQDFGAQANEQAQVVGVAYNDPNQTGSYAPGRGWANVQISAVNLTTGQVSSTQTWSSGGYELSLAPGQYQLIASLNNQVIKRSRQREQRQRRAGFVLTQHLAGRIASECHLGRPAVANSIRPLRLSAVTTPATPQPCIAPHDRASDLGDHLELVELERQQSPII